MGFLASADRSSYDRALQKDGTHVLVEHERSKIVAEVEHGVVTAWTGTNAAGEEVPVMFQRIEERPISEVIAGVADEPKVTLKCWACVESEGGRVCQEIKCP